MCLYAEGPLTAAKLQRTGVGIHWEVFKVHGTFCSHGEPADMHTHAHYEGRVKQHSADTGEC